MPTDDQKGKKIRDAISAQEQLRGIVDDSVIDMTIGVLQNELTKHLSTAHESEQQRKMVTVLFMDVVNSTRMIQGMDPEESMEVLDVSLQAMAERPDSTGLLSQMDFPVSIIAGEKDTITSVEEAGAMAALCPAAILNIIPDAAHLSNMEKPQEFNNVLWQLLQQVHKQQN